MGLPRVLLGFVKGNVRWEKCGGLSCFDGRNTLFIKQRPVDGWAVTHLQKSSKFGFLVMWPFCFHVWWTFNYQEKDTLGTWLPGTEKVFYLRFPGWRWEAGGCSYILSKGYIGLHWD